MPEEEIMACVEEELAYGFGTVVLKSGVDFGLDGVWMTHLIKHIKNQTPIAVTLGQGERSKRN